MICCFFIINTITFLCINFHVFGDIIGSELLNNIMNFMFIMILELFVVYQCRLYCSFEMGVQLFTVFRLILYMVLRELTNLNYLTLPYQGAISC